MHDIQRICIVSDLEMFSNYKQVNKYAGLSWGRSLLGSTQAPLALTRHEPSPGTLAGARASSARRAAQHEA